MQTRREQVRAYRFVTRRIVSALLSGDPETTDLPMRRLGMALVGSILVAAIVLAGVGAYGLLRPGGGQPADNSLVIERETGARYVFLSGTLYPVVNYASALLILGTAAPPVQTLSRNSLRGLPRSRQTYGIVNAPDSLPDPHSLLGLPWSVCSAPQSADSTTPATRVLVGEVPPGGTPLGDGALLVSFAGTSTRFLLWHDQALRIAGNGALAALGMAATTPLAVGPALINGTTVGPDLKIPKIDRDGTPSSRVVDGRRVPIGTIFHDEHGQHYMMLPDGLSTIGEPMADLILSSGRRDNPIHSSLAGGMLVNRTIEPAGFPQTLPSLHQPTGAEAAVCTVYTRVTDTDTESTVLLYDHVPSVLVPSASETATVQGSRGVRTAEFVTVAGQGALVQPVSAPGAATGGSTVFLVTAQGFRYALDNRTGDAKTALGYGATTPVAVPLSVVSLIPLGSTLSIAAARKPPSQATSAPPSPSPLPTLGGTPSKSATPRSGTGASASPKPSATPRRS